jgi:hypothetical protein
VTYKEATAIIDSLVGSIDDPDGAGQAAPQYALAARAEEDRAEAIEAALAFATVWRHDMDDPEFIDPPAGLLALVEYLIGEPVERTWGAPVADG